MYTVNSYWIPENINFSLNLFKGKWRKIKKLDFISVPSVRSISQNLMFYPYKPWGKVFSSSPQQFTNITYKTVSRLHHKCKLLKLRNCFVLTDSQQRRSSITSEFDYMAISLSKSLQIITRICLPSKWMTIFMSQVSDKNKMVSWQHNILNVIIKMYSYPGNWIPKTNSLYINKRYTGEFSWGCSKCQKILQFNSPCNYISLSDLCHYFEWRPWQICVKVAVIIRVKNQQLISMLLD